MGIVALSTENIFMETSAFTMVRQAVTIKQFRKTHLNDEHKPEPSHNNYDVPIQARLASMF